MTDEKKRSAVNDVEDTLACVAFAEEGEVCPLCSAKAEGTAPAAGATKKTSLIEGIEDDLACTAFSDQNESCPICKGKKG